MGVIPSKHLKEEMSTITQGGGGKVATGPKGRSYGKERDIRG